MRQILLGIVWRTGRCSNQATSINRSEKAGDEQKECGSQTSLYDFDAKSQRVTALWDFSYKVIFDFHKIQKTIKSILTISNIMIR